jgi:hypothetical protein
MNSHVSDTVHDTKLQFTALIILGTQDNHRVGGADDRADLLIELQKRHELGPRISPQPNDRRILLLPLLTELGEGIQRSGLRRRGVHWFQVTRDR